MKTTPFQGKLNDSLTKERGGRHGGKGHEFQRYWALCHLLKLDVECDDYVLLLEFIEDVAVLDSSDNPTGIDLFQLKKNEGTSGKWSRATIATAKKGPDGKPGKSILAKLHESHSTVGSEARSISFVSNAPVDLKLGDGGLRSIDRAEFRGAIIADDVKSELRKSIAKELSCCETEIDFNDWVFVRSPLAMNDLENHVTGIVATYLANKFPGHGARADVLCKAVYSEIKVRATATDEAATFQELKRIRGISKAQFSGMLTVTLNKKSDTDIVEGIVSSLAGENVPFMQRTRVRKALLRFLVDKAGKVAFGLDALIEEIESVQANLPDSLATLWDVGKWIADCVINNDASSRFAIYDADYILAVALYKVYQ